MNALDEWTAAVCRDLGLEGLDRKLLLDVARDVAHGVARPAAPLTTYLVGLAAGRAGGNEQDVRNACERVLALVESWPQTAAGIQAAERAALPERTGATALSSRPGEAGAEQPSPE
ncbi:MAG: DUF6457 domain-containing protein [Actinomycetota bacterium]|nr:DUF6457 domain-containing protein [Actinomycetota bacterium]